MNYCNMITDGGISRSANGAALIYEYSIEKKLKKNTPYTLIAKVVGKSVVTSGNTYIGVHGVNSVGNYNLVNLQYCDKPEDDIYINIH